MSDKELYEKAVEFAKENGKCGISSLQRHLKLPLAYTQEILDEMERDGIVCSCYKRITLV